MSNVKSFGAIIDQKGRHLEHTLSCVFIMKGQLICQKMNDCENLHHIH